MGFIGNIVGGILGAGAAGDAANTLSSGAKQAQALELKNQQLAQGSQATATATNTAAEQPFLSLGQTSANNLNSFLQTPFAAPTLAQAEQNPGYQFALQQGTAALDKGAAARGNVFSGTEGTALTQYGQGLGEQNYQQVYNNALNNYMTRYQTLMGGTGVGLQSAGEQGQLGQAGAQNLGNIDLSGAQQQAQQINNAAAARASGYLGQARGYGQLASGIAGAVAPIAGGFGNLDPTGGSSFGEQVQNFYQGM